MLLIRTETSDEGTFGILFFNNEYLFTGECPWRNNEPFFSCIPEGTYEMRMRHSPSFGQAYEVCDVHGRTDVLFHHGNYCGDTKKHLRSDVEGCILLGKKTGTLSNQKVVFSSRLAREHFEKVMNFEPTTLRIVSNEKINLQF